MKEIKAKEGMYLTQFAETENRIYVTTIKGMNINEADWRDATLEEKETFEKSLEETNENIETNRR